jgi:phage shock protein A
MLQLQTLISRVAQLESQMSQLESKLDTYSTAQAACNQCARDSTTSTSTCCETSQATIWKPTSFIAMFERMNNKMLQLESLVASTAALSAVS